MTQPDVGDVHVNALLTNVSIAHMPNLEHFVSDQMFPAVPSEKQSDIYAVYNRGDFHQGSEDAQAMRNLLRAPGTRAPIAGYRISTNPFFAQNFAVGAEIPDELRGNADAVFNLDRDATQLVTMIQMIRRERAWANAFMTTGVWGTDVVGTTDFVKWSDYGGSDPLGDLETGLDTIEAETGQRPNKIAMGAIVWRRLKYHPDVIDRIRGGATTERPALVQRRLISEILEVDEILVGRATYRSSYEGAALTMARILDDDVLMLYANPTPGLMQPTAGITFYWRPLTGGSLQFVRKYRMEPERKDVIEAHSYIAQVATEAESGYFLSDVVD